MHYKNQKTRRYTATYGRHHTQYMARLTSLIEIKSGINPLKSTTFLNLLISKMQNRNTVVQYNFTFFLIHQWRTIFDHVLVQICLEYSRATLLSPLCIYYIHTMLQCGLFSALL